MARRPSQPNKKNSIAHLIESLPFLASIDTMLMEGLSAADVAKYIQEEMGELADLDPRSLANALGARRKQKEELARSISARAAEGGDQEAEVQDDPKPVRPTLLVKELYQRTRGGIRDLLELEALYLTQRDRVDRMVGVEAKQGVFAKDVGAEIIFATDIIMARTKLKKDLGIDDAGETPVLDMRRYSERTVGVLKRPESRHRIMSLLERMAKSGRIKVVEEEQIALPPPPEE